MNCKKNLAAAIVLGCCALSVPAFAQEPTPTAGPTVTATPTITPTPSACDTVKGCINAAVPTAVAQCSGATPACTDKPDKYAVTAGQIAERAIENGKCSKAKTKFGCNACYQRIKLPLRLRFDVKIFHGLLAQAISQIEDARKVACASLGTNGGNGGNGGKGPRGPKNRK